MRVALFIPCYNVAGTLAAVLGGIPPALLARFEQVLLVDNGSTHGTRELMKDFVRKNPRKFRAFFNQANYSLGGSAIVAIREARLQGMDFLVCLHSDGQADPRELERFFPLLPAEDFVFGSRMVAGSDARRYSKLRWYGNLFFAKLQQLLLRQEIYDIGAIMALNLRTVGQFPYAGITANMAYFPALVLYIATKKKLRCREFPISWGEVHSSNVNIWSYGLAHLARIGRLALGLYRVGEAKAEDFISSEWLTEKRD